jgi:Flp pilus assembly protein TadG
MTQSGRENERGAIAVFMMLILTVVMGFAAMAFDLSYVRLARFEMKNATDAASHAAMHVLYSTKSVDQAQTAAEAVASQNTVLGYSVTLSDSDVTFGTWDYNSNTFAPSATVANAVQVNGHSAEPTAPDGTVLTTFGRAIGFGSANIAQTSYGAYRTRATMFEQDITGSFLQVSCAIDQAIAADLAFLDDMYNAGIYDDRLGLDVFTGQAQNFTPLQKLGANYLTMKSLWLGDGLPSKTSAHTSGLGVCTKPTEPTGNYSPCPGGPSNPWPNELKLSPTVANIDCSFGDFHYFPTTTVYGGTNIGAAIKSGIAALSAANNYDIRSVVVFTDGGPVCCEAPQGGGNCQKDGSGNIPKPCCADGTDLACADNSGDKACQCARDVAQYGVDEANVAAADNIDVYILAFGNKVEWVDYAKTLARGRGFPLNTSDPAQLKANLLQISNKLEIALVQ